MTTIASRVGSIEYVYSGEQLSEVKQYLAQKLKAYSKKKREERQSREFEFGPERSSEGGLAAADEADQSIASLASVALLSPEQNNSAKPDDEAARPPKSAVAVEVSKQSTTKMCLKIRQFAPYICDSMDLSEFGFDETQKRQLLQPADLTISYAGLIKIETFGGEKPARFVPVSKTEMSLGKSLFKVTFSDLLVVQAAYLRAVESQQAYEAFLVEFLEKQQQMEKQTEDQEVEQDDLLDVPPGDSFVRSASGLSSGRMRRRQDSFQSFTRMPSLAIGRLASRQERGELDERELLKQEAQQLAQRLGSNLVAYMTGAGSGAHLMGHQGSVALSSRKNSEYEFFDARSRSRSSLSGHSHASESRRRKRSIKARKDNATPTEDGAVLLDSHNDSLEAQRHEQPGQLSDSKAPSRRKATMPPGPRHRARVAMIVEEEKADEEEDQLHPVRRPDDQDSEQLFHSAVYPPRAAAAGKTGDSKVQKLVSLGSIKANMDAVEPLQEESDSDEEFILWEIDYSGNDSPSGLEYKTKVQVAGLHMMIINDHESVFYPILQLNLEKLSLTVDNKPTGMKADTEIRVLLSYYNATLDAWEPFLERAHLRLTVAQNPEKFACHCGLLSPLNFNISEELIETVMPAL